MWRQKFAAADRKSQQSHSVWTMLKFHAGSEQPLMYVVINNSHYLAVTTTNPAYHAFGKYWMEARRLLDYRLKFCWLNVICCICQSRELEREIKQKTGGTNGGPAKNLGGKAHQGPPWESPLQMDIHKTLYPFYTTKKMPHVMVTITKNASLAAIARY